MTASAATSASSFDRAPQSARRPILSHHITRFVATFVRRLAAVRPTGESRTSDQDLYIGL